MKRARTIVTFTVISLLLLTFLAPASAAGRTVSVRDLLSSAQPAPSQPEAEEGTEEKAPVTTTGRWVSVGDLPGFGTAQPPSPEAPAEGEASEGKDPDPVSPPQESPETATTQTDKVKWVRVADLLNPPAQQPSSPTDSDDLPSIPAGLSSAEKQFLQYLNQERAAAGLEPLTVDMALVELARMKAQDITEYNYSGHTSPTYGTPSYMARQAGVTFTRLGETIVKSGDPYKGHKLLMGSTAHRNILLSSSYTRVGIGVDYYNGKHNSNGLVGVTLLAN